MKDNSILPEYFTKIRFDGQDLDLSISLQEPKILIITDECDECLNDSKFYQNEAIDVYNSSTQKFQPCINDFYYLST